MLTLARGGFGTLEWPGKTVKQMPRHRNRHIYTRWMNFLFGTLSCYHFIHMLITAYLIKNVISRENIYKIQERRKLEDKPGRRP